MLVSAFHTFINDGKVQGLLLLIALDFVLGIAASVKTKTFSLGYITQFLKDDVAFKVLPYFVFYLAAIISGGTDIVIPGLDMGVIAGSIYVVVVGAMVASLLGSLSDFGFTFTPKALRSTTKV